MASPSAVLYKMNKLFNILGDSFHIKSDSKPRQIGNSAQLAESVLKCSQENDFDLAELYQQLKALDMTDFVYIIGDLAEFMHYGRFVALLALCSVIGSRGEEQEIVKYHDWIYKACLTCDKFRDWIDRKLVLLL